MPQIPFVGPSYQARSPAIAADRLINMYPEVRDVPKRGTTEVAGLYNTPGYVTVTNLQSGPIRGLYTTSTGRTFTVADDALLEVFAGGGTVARGTVAFHPNPMAMTDNGVELVLSDGVTGYAMPLATNVLAPMTAEGFVPSTHLGFVDGYIVAMQGGGRWGISGLYNAQAWDAAEFVVAEASPDPLRALAVHNRLVWALGTKSTQGYFNAGLVDFPFASLQGAEIEEGIVAPYSVQSMGDLGIVWLGQDAEGGLTVQRLGSTGGFQLDRLSTPAIEYALQQTPNIAQTRSWQYHDEGHHFYALTTATHTWVWDASTGLWHERGVLNAQGTIVPLPIGCSTFAFGTTHLLGDLRQGRLYALDATRYTYDGALMPSIRQWQGTAEEEGAVFHHALHIFQETGVGLNVAEDTVGYEPLMSLQYSDDRGRTWSHDRTRSLGRFGEYGLEVGWHRLGRAPVGRIYRVMVTDPVKRVWYGAHLRATAVAS